VNKTNNDKDDDYDTIDDRGGVYIIIKPRRRRRTQWINHDIRDFRKHSIDCVCDGGGCYYYCDEK